MESSILYHRTKERQIKVLSTVEEKSEKSEAGSDNIPFIDTNEIESEAIRANQIEVSVSHDQSAYHVVKSCDSESQSDTQSVSTPDTVILTG